MSNHPLFRNNQPVFNSIVPERNELIYPPNERPKIPFYSVQCNRQSFSQSDAIIAYLERRVFELEKEVALLRQIQNSTTDNNHGTCPRYRCPYMSASNIQPYNEELTEEQPQVNTTQNQENTTYHTHFNTPGETTVFLRPFEPP